MIAQKILAAVRLSELNSQESPNMVEVFKDFDWQLDRFVEYTLPIKKPLYFLGLELKLYLI